MRSKRVADMNEAERATYEREKARQRERRRNDPEYRERERVRDAQRHRENRKKSADALAKHALNRRWQRIYVMYEEACDRWGAPQINAALTQIWGDAMISAQGNTDRGESDDAQAGTDGQGTPAHQVHEHRADHAGGS